MNTSEETHTHNTPAIVAPVAWQKFDDWCLTGQHGKRPIYLSVGGRPGKKVMTVRNPVSDRLEPLTPDHPVAVQIVEAFNSHAALTAQRDAALAALKAALAHPETQHHTVYGQVKHWVALAEAAIALCEPASGKGGAT